MLDDPVLRVLNRSADVLPSILTELVQYLASIPRGGPDDFLSEGI